MPRLFLFSAVLCFYAPTCSAQVGATFIHGNPAWHPKTLALTLFDGPDDPDPADDVSWSYKLAKALAEWKDPHGNPVPVYATFFVNLCRFKGQDAPIPESNNCYFYGFVPISLLGDYLRLGHRVANHTDDHPNLAYQPYMTEALIVSQVSKLQHILEPYQKGQTAYLGPPNLAWNSFVVDALAKDPYIKASGLVGPVGCDFCGNGTVHGKVVSCDTDCMAYGFTPEDCSDVIVNAVLKDPDHKGIIQLHDRPQWNVGKGKGMQAVLYVVSKLPPTEYHYVFLDYVEPKSSREFAPPSGSGGHRGR